MFLTSPVKCGDRTDQRDSSVIIPGRLAIVVVGAAGLVAGAHLQNYNSFWKGERGAFHFNDDGRYNFGMDKLGHFFFTYAASDAIGRSLDWAGVQTPDACLFGGAAALAFQLYVEIEDGFTPSLGFSVGDAIADVAGASYPLLQASIPFFQNVRWKWSFIKSDRFKRGEYRSIIDDYESQYHWLSIDFDNIIPQEMRNPVLSYFALALGYGVKKLDGRGKGEPEIFIALDYDVEKLPGDGSVLNALKHIANYFHLPSPMIRIAPSFVTYGIRF